MTKEEDIPVVPEVKRPPRNEGVKVGNKLVPSFSISIFVDPATGMMDAKILGSDIPYNAIQFALYQAQQRFREEEIYSAIEFALQQKGKE